MKHERTLVTYERDECKKISQELEQPSKPLYKDGWTYLHRIEIVTENGREVITDKHFCSKEHLIQYIERKLNLR